MSCAEVCSCPWSLSSCCHSWSLRPSSVVGAPAPAGSWSLATHPTRTEKAVNPSPTACVADSPLCYVDIAIPVQRPGSSRSACCGDHDNILYLRLFKKFTLKLLLIDQFQTVSLNSPQYKLNFPLHLTLQLFLPIFDSYSIFFFKVQDIYILFCNYNKIIYVLPRG